MSKLARKPIKFPPGLTVKLESDILKVKGPKGTLEKPVPAGIELKIASDSITVSRKNDEKPVRMLHGMYTSMISNMLKGVTEGFKKELELVGVGYKADVKDKSLVLNVGFTVPVVIPIPGTIGIKVEDKQTKVIITGLDKDGVGLLAAKIRAIKPPDSYKGKGIKFVNEVLKLKPGKSAAGSTGAGTAGGAAK
jgi:large subunit ribosomal protein L6